MGQRKLTEKQRRFAEALLGAANGNATEAARLAGYSGGDSTMRALGTRLQQNAAVVAYIEELRAEATAEAKGHIATRAERQAFWTEVLGDTGEAMKDRLKAAELLGKSQGDFVRFNVKLPYEDMDDEALRKRVADVVKRQK